MRHGLVIGKFTPFHLGHAHLIETALAESDRVTVLVVDSPEYKPVITTRKTWIQRHFVSEAMVPVGDVRLRAKRLAVHRIEKGDLPDSDSEGWAVAAVDRLKELSLWDGTITVFSSEDYGPRWASFMGVNHRSVDNKRTTVPCSGTMIRDNLKKNFDYLPTEVQKFYRKKVCIVGAESTGKTTLAKALGEWYKTPFVPEYGRYFTEALPSPTTYRWELGDFVHIIERQSHIVRQSADDIGPVMICDATAGFTTRLFAEAYGVESPTVTSDPYDLFILTDPTTPFVMDATGLRDESKREWFHERYFKWLEKKNYIEVKGGTMPRVYDSVQAIDKLFAAV